MATRDDTGPLLQDPMGPLERLFVEEYLADHNNDPGLIVEARKYAAGRLAEVEARAHYVHEIHGARRR